MRSRRAAGKALLLLPLAACYASNVVAPKDRAVAVPLVQLAWQPATPADVVGYFESVAVEGDAALSVRRVLYRFAADGSYTGAALVDDGEHEQFQTLSGRWSLADAELVLDDGAPAVAEAAPDHLRLSTPQGTLVLVRTALH